MLEQYHGDCRAILPTLPAQSVQCVITSPPYFGLRDYGTAQWDGGDPACDHVAAYNLKRDTSGGLAGGRDKGTRGEQPSSSSSVIQYRDTCGKCGARRIDQQIGLESLHDCLAWTRGEPPCGGCYVCALRAVFAEVWRVLRDDGVVFLNLGDSYAGSGKGFGGTDHGKLGPHANDFLPPPIRFDGLKPKDLIGIPWRVAFALQADGWYLRSDIIWSKPNCLSGGAIVYAKTQKGEMPMMVKDLVRLDPATVQLWSGQRWTQAVAWIHNPRPADPIELVLRNGQRISCTPDHLWPTQRGNVRAEHLSLGDVIQTCTLPEPSCPTTPRHIPDEIGWLVGLYLAEGSRSNDTIQIAGHQKEVERYERLCAIAAAYGGTCQLHHFDGHKAAIHLTGRLLNAIIDTYIGGQTAHDKHLKVACWRRSNAFLRAVLDGYLSGDGHYDAKNNRWRLAFTRNYYLESDLRTLCARLGIPLRLNLSTHAIGDKVYPTFRGELRFERSTHHNNKQDGEVIAIQRSRARHFWDISVADEPHLFALASGVLTHNCMPESVRDRPTRSHEYIFLLTKQERYYYDAEAIKEPVQPQSIARIQQPNFMNQTGGPKDYRNGTNTNRSMRQTLENFAENPTGRNKRSVWHVATSPYAGAHFAVFPEALIEPCVLAGSSPQACETCGAPWARVVERKTQSLPVEERYGRAGHNGTPPQQSGWFWTPPETIDHGWQPTCRCATNTGAGRCVILDPFGGSGTTGRVALKHGRRAILIDLNESYLALQDQRTNGVQVVLPLEAAS